MRKMTRAATLMLGSIIVLAAGCGSNRDRGSFSDAAVRDAGATDAPAGDAGVDDVTTRNVLIFFSDSYHDSLGGSSLNLYLDGEMVSPPGGGFGRDYPGVVTDVEAGIHDLRLENDFDGTTVYVDTVATLAEGTLLWFGGNESTGTIELSVAEAWAEQPAPDHGVIRAIHSAPSLGPIDVYVLPRGGSVTGATPTISSVAPRAISDFVELPVGDVTIAITEAGTTTLVGDPVDSRIHADFARFAVATENCHTRECDTPETSAPSSVCLGIDPQHCYRE